MTDLSPSTRTRLSERAAAILAILIVIALVVVIAVPRVNQYERAWWKRGNRRCQQQHTRASQGIYCQCSGRPAQFRFGVSSSVKKWALQNSLHFSNRHS